jgi:hypothetical protein
MAPDARRSLARHNVATMQRNHQRRRSVCTAPFDDLVVDRFLCHSGARESANPESIYRQTRAVEWIPGLRLPRKMASLICRDGASRNDPAFSASNVKQPNGRAPAFPWLEPPGLCKNFTLGDTEGAGNAGCWPHPQPCVQIEKHASKSPQVWPERSGIPCATVLTAAPRSSW